MVWTYVSEHAYHAEGCICSRSRGDNADCPLHQGEYKLRRTGCSCWAGFRMTDGSYVDPYCNAHRRGTPMNDAPPTQCLNPFDWWTAMIVGSVECGECDYCEREMS